MRSSRRRGRRRRRRCRHSEANKPQSSEQQYKVVVAAGIGAEEGICWRSFWSRMDSNLLWLETRVGKSDLGLRMGLQES